MFSFVCLFLSWQKPPEGEKEKRGEEKVQKTIAATFLSRARALILSLPPSLLELPSTRSKCLLTDILKQQLQLWGIA